jgi:hypothetical protein
VAKALFHKGQRVYVKSVGTWATVEQVVPHWVSSVEEPLRVYYDVGLGRNFAAHELVKAEAEKAERPADVSEHWRIQRLRSHWEFDGDRADGRNATFPVVVTDALDWGGWRVPKAEYDRDPERIEMQAKYIAAAPEMVRIVRELLMLAEERDAAPERFAELLTRAGAVHKAIFADPEAAADPLPLASAV